MSSTGPQVRRRPRPVIEHPTYKSPSYHSRIWGRLVFFIFLVALCATIGVSGGLYYGLHKAQGGSGRTLNFHVGTGDTVTTVANRLEREGVINSALLFRVDAKIQNLAGNLKVGDFVLRKNMSIDDMVAALQIYHTNYINVVVPEGFRMEQIAARLTTRWDRCSIVSPGSAQSESQISQCERPLRQTRRLRPRGVSLPEHV